MRCPGRSCWLVELAVTVKKFREGAAPLCSDYTVHDHEAFDQRHLTWVLGTTTWCLCLLLYPCALQTIWILGQLPS